MNLQRLKRAFERLDIVRDFRLFRLQPIFHFAHFAQKQGGAAQSSQPQLPFDQRDAGQFVGFAHPSFQVGTRLRAGDFDFHLFGRFGRGLGDLGGRFVAFGQAAELETARGFSGDAAFFEVGRVVAKLFGFFFDRQIGDNRGQSARVQRLFAVLAQQVLDARRRHLVQVFVNAVERTVFFEQGNRGFSPMPGTPGMLSEASPLRPL